MEPVILAKLEGVKVLQQRLDAGVAPSSDEVQWLLNEVQLLCGMIRGYESIVDELRNPPPDPVEEQARADELGRRMRSALNPREESAAYDASRMNRVPDVMMRAHHHALGPRAKAAAMPCPSTTPPPATKARRPAAAARAAYGAARWSS